jgi:uncharacterized protein involved in tolerance to divalent cations
MSEDYLVVLVTVPTAETGEKLAKVLLNERTVACVI